MSINSTPPGQNGRHFTDNIFKCIFMNENIRISTEIKGLFQTNSAFVQLMLAKISQIPNVLHVLKCWIHKVLKSSISRKCMISWIWI